MMEDRETVFPHERLDVYHVFLRFAGLSEAAVLSAGASAVADQLERATESIGTNLVRGNSQWAQAVRAASFDVSMASALECAACLDVCFVKKLIGEEQLGDGKAQLSRIVGMLFGLKKSSYHCVREDTPPYGQHVFAHERLDVSLDVYRVGLEFIGWVDAFSKRDRLHAREGRKLDVASTSVVLNIAEGNGRFSEKDRARFLETAIAVSLQSALLLDLLEARGHCIAADTAEGKTMVNRIYSMLMGWRRNLRDEDHAERTEDR